MVHLTKQERLVLCAVIGLLLTGWAVKAYRTAHPRAERETETAPSAQGNPAEDKSEQAKQ
jgi:hypothetical protein